MSRELEILRANIAACGQRAEKLLPRAKFNTMLGSDEVRTGEFIPPVINIGMGEDLLIRKLAEIG